MRMEIIVCFENEPDKLNHVPCGNGFMLDGEKLKYCLCLKTSLYDTDLVLMLKTALPL